MNYILSTILSTITLYDDFSHQVHTIIYQEQGWERTEYDMEIDMISVYYKNNVGNKYIFKFDRKIAIDVKKIIIRFKNIEMAQDAYLSAELNKEQEDISKYLNQLAGPDGYHFVSSPLQVKHVLNGKQLNILTVMDCNCMENDYYDENKYLQLE